ncbi:MAG: glycoside hydrolase family 1 protein [Streptosporangiaceae bacterium]
MQAADVGPVEIPAGFLLGAATSAYQIEGAADADGRGVSIWDTFSHAAGNTSNGDTGDVACRHYDRLTEDLDLLADLGASAYRFSVSWPRIQPTGKGPASPEGVDFYRRLVHGLRDRGILPVLTLYHWELPQPLQDAGGWPQRDTAARFAEFASLVAESLGDEVGMWITLNEPWCSAWLGYGNGQHAPGIRDIGQAAAATHHLLLGHGLGTQAIRSALPSAKVGITLNLTPVRAATAHPDDAAAALRTDGQANRLFLDPLFTGSYPADVLEHYRGRDPGFTVIGDGDLAVISAPMDFLGVNFYSPRTVADRCRGGEARAAGYCVPLAHPDPISADLGVLGALRPDSPRTEMGWEIDAGALTALLTRVDREYAQIPMLITENGAACADYVAPDGVVRDPERIRYLHDHLAAVLQARAAGADVRGYFAWTLLDNFEWAHGFTKRFGLVWVDYPTSARIPKDSFRWYRDTARARALAPLPPSAARLYR